MTKSELYKMGLKLPLSPATIARNTPKDDIPSPPPPVARPSVWAPPRGIPDDGMNQTERKYLAFLRAKEEPAGNWIGVHNITLKIGHDCRLTMDFAVLDESGLRLIDTKHFNKKTNKPHIEDDALVKMRVAADRFPWIRFVVAWEEGGLWQHEDVVPYKDKK